MKNIEQINLHIEELETKLTFQEELIEQLNHSLITQQQDIVKLTRMIERMSNQMEDMRQPNVVDSALETPPPHY